MIILNRNFITTHKPNNTNKKENNRKTDRRIKSFSLDRNVGSLQNRPFWINV